MLIAAITLKLRAPWARSLKDKRAEVKRLLAKLRGKFNASACETDMQDERQTIVISVAAIAPNRAQADSIMDHVLDYVEEIAEAELVETRREIR